MKKNKAKEIKKKHFADGNQGNGATNRISPLKRKLAPISVDRNKNLYIGLGIIVILFLVLNLMKTWNENKQYAGIDFYQFWVAGKVVSEFEFKDVYSDKARHELGLEFLRRAQSQPQSERFLIVAQERKILETYSTPFLYSVFQYFAIDNYEFDLKIYTGFLVLCYILAIVLFCILLDYSLVRTLIAIIIFIGWFEPFSSEIRVANVNTIQLVLLALFAWVQSKYTWKAHYFLGGLVLGFAVLFKPNIVFVVGMLFVSWLLNRHYRKLIIETVGMLTAIIGSFIFSMYHFSSTRIWIDWFIQFRKIPDTIISINLGNYAFARFIKDVTGTDVSIYLQILFIVVSVLFIWITRQRIISRTNKQQENEASQKQELYNDILMIIMGCLIYLISAPLVWLHYLLLAIPAVLMVFRPLNSTHLLEKKDIWIRRIIPALSVAVINFKVLRALNDISSYYLLTALYVFPLIFFSLTLLELWYLKPPIRLQNTL